MMLAKIGTIDLLHSKEYFFEPKLDGFRALLQVKNRSYKLFSRTNRDITQEFSEISFDIKKDCILDGEIVAYDKSGNPSFSLMQTRKAKAHYVAFDILSFEGKNLKAMPIEERKKLLEKVAGKSKSLQVISYTDDGLALWKIIIQRHLEGVLAKRKGSLYVDTRSNDWIKIKNNLTVDCVIVGFVSKIRKIASLSLALYDDNKLIYIGQVGTGFNEALLKELDILLEPSKNDVVLPRTVVSVQPKNVCEIKYLIFTKDRRLRAPVFLRLREDKKPRECTIDQVIISD